MKISMKIDHTQVMNMAVVQNCHCWWKLQTDVGC